MLARDRSPIAPTRRSLGAMLAAGAVLALPAVAAATPAEPDAELIALGRELEAAWSVERETIKRFEGDESPKAERHCCVCFDRSGSIVRRIEALPATTLAGLRVKLLAFDWTWSGDPISVAALFGEGHETTDHRLVVAILTDLRNAMTLPLTGGADVA